MTRARDPQPALEGAAVGILMTGAVVPSRPIDDTLMVHRAWEIADLDGFLAETGEQIRGIAASGRMKIDETLMARLPNLEIVANFGVGYDRIDVAQARARGIVVTNTPDVLTDEVADLTVGLMLATTRQMILADRFVRSGRWPRGDFPLSDSLRNRVIGIVGLGRIGKAVARRCAAMNVEVCYFGRSEQPDQPYRYLASLPALAAAADVLILTVPGAAGTDRLIDAAVLDALGPEGILINVSRGSVVDEPALVAALASGRIKAAGLDVFQNEPDVPRELIAMDNVVLLPHVGSGTVTTRRAMGQLVLDNLTSWFAGRGPLTPVPETPRRSASTMSDQSISRLQNGV